MKQKLNRRTPLECFRKEHS